MNKNYESCFHHVSGNWQEKWSLIRQFTIKWHGIEFRDCEELLPLVRQEEAKLGFELPPSFQEYIMFSVDIDCNRENRFIKNNHIEYSLLKHKTRKVIRDDYKVEYFKNLSAVSLLRLLEGDAFWAVKKDNLGQADPPVETYMLNDIGCNSYDDYALNSSIKEKGFGYSGCYSSSITDFVLSSMLLFLYGEKESYAKFSEANSKLISNINNIFERELNW